MSGYCDIAPGHPLHGPYHDHEYGFPQREEAVLFERLLLEINRQALVIAEQDESEAVNNPDRPTRRVNLGVYLYAEDETPDAPKA